MGQSVVWQKAINEVKCWLTDHEITLSEKEINKIAERSIHLYVDKDYSSLENAVKDLLIARLKRIAERDTKAVLRHTDIQGKELNMNEKRKEIITHLESIGVYENVSDDIIDGILASVGSGNSIQDATDEVFAAQNKIIQFLYSIKRGDKIFSLTETEMEAVYQTQRLNYSVLDIEENLSAICKELKLNEYVLRLRPDFNHILRQAGKLSLEIQDKRVSMGIDVDPQSAFVEAVKNVLEVCPVSKGTGNDNCYEVAFVVEGYIREADDPIGNIECNGTCLEQDGTYRLIDGRAYYTVVADSPLEAWKAAQVLFEEDDIGSLEVTGSRLEHVSLGDYEGIMECAAERDEL